MEFLGGWNALGEDSSAHRRRVEWYVWRTRWALLAFGSLLILTLHTPPLWLSYAALAGATLHNAVFRRALVVHGSATQLRWLGNILFLLDAGMLLIGIWPILRQQNHVVPLLLLVIPLEAIPRLGFERPCVLVSGLAILTLIIVMYIVLNLRKDGWWTDAIIWTGFYGLIGMWAAFVSQARWHAPPMMVPRPDDGKDILPNPLTQRQREVLRLVAAGKSTHEIADILSIGTETVRTHLRDIAKALGTRSRHEAAQIARERGYLD